MNGPDPLRTVAGMLAERQGVDGRSIGSSMFEDALRTRQRELGLPALDIYLQRVMRDASECDALGQALLVSETWFDRDPKQLQALDRLLASGAIRAPAVVWSAPCASGEECYSIAARFLAAGWRAEDVSVLGLDYSAAALAKAGSRTYPGKAWRSIDSVPEWLHPCSGGMLCVDAKVAAMVSFRQCNLVQPNATAGLAAPQIVFSRNFFIYLTQQARTQWLDTLSALAGAGTLVFSGPGECISAWDPRFEIHPFHPYLFGQRHTLKAEAVVTDTKAQAHATAHPPLRSSAIPQASRSKAAPAFDDDDVMQRARPAPAAFVAAPDPSPDARELADKGLTTEALQALRSRLAAREATADDFVLEASLLMAHGQRQFADDALRRALYLDPAHGEARALRAAIHKASGAGARETLEGKR